MPEWSKGCDLRSHGESLVGSNPTPSINKFLLYVFTYNKKLELRKIKLIICNYLSYIVINIFIKNLIIYIAQNQ